MNEQPRDTHTRDYTLRLERLSGAPWKRWLNVQAPYRWNLRRLELGFTLDIGCGVGRNLLHLDGCGVGVDPNPHSVAAARGQGLTAYASGDFRGSAHAVAESFDSLLLAHVAEHVGLAAATALVGDYLEFLKRGGKVVVICPQEAGQRSDPSHVEFMPPEKLRRILTANGLEPLRSFSFPFPRFAGRLFPHNESIAVGGKP